MTTPSIRSLEKALALLRQLARDGGVSSISQVATEISLPLSTAHRIAATFERQGFVVRVKRGHFLPGPALLNLANTQTSDRMLAALGRPVVVKLARETRCIAHLGVLSAGMVTYLLKAGERKLPLFTREGTQLEAYCTGIGKVLLAALPKLELSDYLADGPFIRLTPNTIIDTNKLRRVLAAVRTQGYATDDSEMDTDLRCLAVPVRDSEGRVIAAMSISTSQHDVDLTDLRIHLETLRAAAGAVSRRLQPCCDPMSR